MNAAKTPESFQAAVEAMKNDMGNVIKNQNESIETTKNSISGIFKSTDPAVANQQDQVKQISDFGTKYPALQPQMLKMENDKVSYSDILKWINRQK